LTPGKSPAQEKSNCYVFLKNWLFYISKKHWDHLTYNASFIENIIDFDLKQELEKTIINYNDIIKSSSSERDSNSISQKSIKIDSDYSADDLNSVSSIDKISINQNTITKNPLLTKNELEINNQNSIIEDNNKNPLQGILNN